MMRCVRSRFSHTGASLRQADLALNYHAIIADKATEDEFRRLEQDVMLMETSVNATQANTTMRQGSAQ